MSSLLPGEENRIAEVVQGSTRTPLSIAWVDENGDPVDLTGSTITGTMRPYARPNGEIKAISGSMSPVGGGSNNFTWDLDATDLDTAGKWVVQFLSTAGEADASRTAILVVHERQTVP